jgi:hypothetical protein
VFKWPRYYGNGKIIIRKEVVHFLFQNDKPIAKDRFLLHNGPSNYTTKIKWKLHMNTQIMLMKEGQIYDIIARCWDTRKVEGPGSRGQATNIVWEDVKAAMGPYVFSFGCIWHFAPIHHG